MLSKCLNVKIIIKSSVSRGLLLKQISRKDIVKWLYSSILVCIKTIKSSDKQSGLSEEERNQAEAKFKEIGEAYSVLSDERKKRMFDSGMDVDGSSASDGHGMGHGMSGGVPMDDLLRTFFQQGGHGGQFGASGGFGGFPGHGMGGGMGGGFSFSHGYDDDY